MEVQGAVIVVVLAMHDQDFDSNSNKSNTWRLTPKHHPSYLFAYLECVIFQSTFQKVFSEGHECLRSLGLALEQHVKAKATQFIGAISCRTGDLSSWCLLYWTEMCVCGSVFVYGRSRINGRWHAV